MDHGANDFNISLKGIKIPWSGKSEIKSKSEKNCSYLKASWTKWAGRASQELTRNIWAVPTLAKSSSSSSSYSQAKTKVLVFLILCLLCVYIQCSISVDNHDFCFSYHVFITESCRLWSFSQTSCKRNYFLEIYVDGFF